MLKAIGEAIWREKTMLKISQHCRDVCKQMLSDFSPPSRLGRLSKTKQNADDDCHNIQTFFFQQINAAQQQQQQQHSVTDYAKPTKGVTHYQTSEETVVETTFDKGQERRDQLEYMLGNLQADMSRQGVNTMQKGCCNACDKPIVGQVITALGKTWHPEHFTCNHCNQELGTRNFFERDGNPYCEADYHNLFSPRCAYCNGPILDVNFDHLGLRSELDFNSFSSPEMRDGFG